MIRLGLLIFILLLTFYACKKDRYSDVQPSEDDTFAQVGLSRLFALVNEHGILYSNASDTISEYPFIALSADTFPKQMVITYPADTLLENGMQVKGTLTSTIDTNWMTQGSKLQCSFNDFEINNVDYSGTLTISIDTLSDYFVLYSVVAKSIKIEFDADNSFSWASTQYYYWYEGMETDTFFLDDLFIISGISSGTSLTGRGFEAGTTDSLVYKASCSGGMIVSGKKELIPEEFSMRLIKYGEGLCDESISILFEGTEYNYNL